MKRNQFLAAVSAVQLCFGLGGMALAIHRHHAFDLPGWGLIHSSHLSNLRADTRRPCQAKKSVHISTGQSERFLRMAEKPGHDNGPAV
jgi:hypothetical protein